MVNYIKPGELGGVQRFTKLFRECIDKGQERNDHDAGAAKTKMSRRSSTQASPRLRPQRPLTSKSGLWTTR